MAWLMPPSDDHPATMLRWVRRVELVIAAAGLVFAASFWADGLREWWIMLVAAALGAIGAATMGPAIRRAERHGPNDPSTRTARQRRAERLTLTMFAILTLVSVLVCWLAAGTAAAVTVAIVMALSVALGIRSWCRLRP
ncbi:MAG: hypothetical protein QOE28_2515 [Solirubrobacteraceae bacterium]|nr:hypothetical protein [Solirubrobacteraceae bacterium]